jgi:hypothetical protein
MGETKILLMPWAIVKNWEGLTGSFCLGTAPATNSHFYFSPSDHTSKGLSIYWSKVQPAALDMEMEPPYGNKKGRERA